MRGKTKIWALTVLFIATMAIASVNIPKTYSYPDKTVSLVDPTDLDATFGPHKPGDIFAVNVEIDYVEGLRATDFTVYWNQRVLSLVKPDGQPVPLDPPTLGALLEGPFLKAAGATSPVAALGIAGELVMFSDYISNKDYVDGGGVVAILYFKVVGGGKTGLTFEDPYGVIPPKHRLLNVDFVEIPGSIWVGGYYWGPFPYIAFTWWVPTAIELPPQSTVTTNGTSHYTVVDPDGDIDYVDGPPYLVERPVLTLDDATGAPESVVNFEGGTMFYGDEIIFDASKSYDLDNNGNPVPLDPTKFKWVIRAGGVDTFTYGKVTYDTRYESGVELPYGDKFSYVFPGKLPKVYGIYSRLLGFHDLTLTVTDADGNTATYYTWIRIYRLSPAATKMVVVPDPKHSLSEDGYTMRIGGKVQNKGGTGWFPWDALASYLELARMIHAFMWVRMQFDIKDAAGVPVGTVYSDAVWLGPTETPIDPMWATWTIPKGIGYGTYYVKATAWFCGSGVTYGLQATGVELGDFEILP